MQIKGDFDIMVLSRPQVQLTHRLEDKIEQINDRNALDKSDLVIQTVQ